MSRGFFYLQALFASHMAFFIVNGLFIVQHVDKGKLKTCILKASILLDTVNCWTQELDICWNHFFLDICLVLLFQVLNMLSIINPQRKSFCKNTASRLNKKYKG